MSDAEEWPAFVAELPSDAALYLALPPAVGKRGVETLHGATLPSDLRMAVEKPFGTDRESAVELNEALDRILPAQRVFHVDHFLGFAAARALVPVRYGNRILETVWNDAQVEAIDIVFDEAIGIEGRAAFYEGTGALMDMLQSHLLLLMSLATMERPNTVTADEVHSKMLEVLKAVDLDGDPKESTRRAQYSAGVDGDGHAVAGYRKEEGVDPESTVETLAELRLKVNVPRWAGTTVRLRSGKALGGDRSFVRFTFRSPEKIGAGTDAPVSELRLGLDVPCVQLRLAAQDGVDGFRFAATELTGPLDDGGVTPYGRVLGEFLTDGTMLSVSSEISVECWRIIDPVVAAWKSGEVPLGTYPAGQPD